MLLAPAEYPVSGMELTRSAVPVFSSSSEPMLGSDPLAIESEPPSAFGRLVKIMQSNERLISELRALATRLERARAYLTELGCHRNLATANLAHLKAKYSGVLALLRANRLEARELFGRLNSEPGGDVLDLVEPHPPLVPVDQRLPWRLVI